MRPWRTSIESQLSSWSMYLPGVSASSEIVEVKKFKGGYVLASWILIICHCSDISFLVSLSRRNVGRDERAGNWESWGVQRCHEREDHEGVRQNSRGLQQNALCVEANSCGVLMAAGEVSQHCSVHFFNFNFSDASDWLCPALPCSSTCTNHMNDHSTDYSTSH